MRAFIRDIFLNMMGVFSSPAQGVHILNLHYITKESSKPEDYKIFERFIAYLNAFATFISLEDAEKKIKDTENPITDCFIAFTFDDGFEECYTMIAPILEKYNTRGAFFINANYIESNVSYQNEFNNRISVYTKKPMNWKQVIDLHERGHIIGSHTLDHYNMSSLNNEELKYQVEENKKQIEEKLKSHCHTFAWPYGQMKDFSKEAQLIVEKHHTSIYSGTNYRYNFSRDASILNRRHVEPYWSKRHIKYFLSKEKM